MDRPPSPISELIKNNEKVFVNGDIAIDYLLLKGVLFKDYLIVVFSAFNDTTITTEKTYNYVRTLQDFDGNKLFIKDQYGPQGSYYLGQAPRYAAAGATIELIETIRKELGVPTEKVICIGSSKGGTCAIYFAVTAGYGGAIAGAPQTKIGSYVLKCSQPTYDYMFGNDNALAEQADQILFRACGHKSDTRIWIITSPFDWQYRDHILPFLEDVGPNLQNLRVIADKTMKTHGEIADYLVKNLYRMLIDYILEASSLRYEVDVLDQFHSYNLSEKEYFDEAMSILNLPAERALYLQAFDGTFDVPPKDSNNLLMALLPPHVTDAIIEIEFEATQAVTFNIFFMQYLTIGGCIKTNKTWKCNSGRNVIRYSVAVAKDATLFKPALRFVSSLTTSVQLKAVKISFSKG